MPDSTGASADGSDARWPLVAVGGAVSLCCLFAAPTATGAAGGAVAGGTTAALGGGVIRVAVSALTVGLLAVVWRRRTDASGCEQ
ncbi:hypothetical protein [Halorientalis regularis]|jgi:hypothetical protein|uniref:Uncharacterized protein n=1 Tax=Halorientalis regularis TaxID=660518 RepID=A0A1G7PAP0_9EURY|nr:hypothetical protein [Halorientalis regularis]SDF83187.1 hypothetical protein SAMN05216218_11042 [Halorientalis regularis]